MNQVGKRAEDIACKYLEAKGFTILERNWRCGHLEVDIVASENSNPALVHFVEVKGRVFPSVAAEPSEMVGAQKQKNIIKAASGYLRKKKLSAEAVFDIVAILFKPKGYEISFIRNAFSPLW